jgi:hypothetical protein
MSPISEWRLGHDRRSHLKNIPSPPKSVYMYLYVYCISHKERRWTTYLTLGWLVDISTAAEETHSTMMKLPRDHGAVYNIRIGFLLLSLSTSTTLMVAIAFWVAC